MGSSKKHKEKDKEKSHKRKHKDKKERSRSGSKSPSHHSTIKEKDRSHKKRKEKRKHLESEDHLDGDMPVAKHGKYSTEINRSPSPPPKSSGAGDNLSIDETNKLRIKLGLKPLQVDSGPSRPPPPPIIRNETEGDLEEGEEEDFDEETLKRIREEREKESETFWKEKQDFVHAPAENISAKKKAEKLRDKITTQREKRRLETKLQSTKGLADSDDEDLSDAAKWVERQKKAAEQRALADKRAKALQELDDEFGVGDLVESEYQKQKKHSYTDQHLKGMKVLHGQGRIEEGHSVVLTLKDKGVLDEEDDVLVNVNMIDDEKYEKNLEDRRLRPELHGYNVYDEIEYDEQGNLKGKGVLAKYDEEIQGAQKKSFVIGEDYSEETRRQKIREKMQRADKILESIESPHLQVASDFYSHDEMVAFKKPKKKIRKVRKALRADDILKLNTELPTANGSNQKDLGSRQRRSDTGSNDIKVKHESVDMEIDFDVDDMPAPQDVDVSDVKIEDEADLDFQLALSKARKLKQKQKAVKPNSDQVAELILSDEQRQMEISKADNIGGNIVLHATQEFCRTLGDIPTVDGADIYGDEEMDFEKDERQDQLSDERGTWNEVEIDETPVDITRPPETEEAPILEQEPDVGSGIAGALNLAMKKGYLDHEKAKRAGVSKMRHLQAQHYSIEDKSYDDERTSKRDMYSGPVTDFKEKDLYKPNIKLDYIDEEGKPISSKEAFRLLSHKFHGKGSGKNKIDKKRRKLEQEKLMRHMNSTDTPLNTLELLQQKQKETQSSYVVLSGKALNTSIAKSKR